MLSTICVLSFRTSFILSGMTSFSSVSCMEIGSFCAVWTYVQSRLYLVIINLAVKILTNSNNLSETGDVLTWQKRAAHSSSKLETGWTKHVKHGWEREDVYSEISSEHKWTKNLMIIKFPNTISSGKILYRYLFFSYSFLTGHLSLRTDTHFHNLFGNPLYWNIFLLRKCIPDRVKIMIWRSCSQGINCFPLSQVKVDSFCFRAPVRRAGCGGLLVNVTADFDWTFSRHVLKTLDELPWKASFSPFFLVGRTSIEELGSKVESGGNFEDYIRFLSCHPTVWSGESWSDLERLGEKWWKSLIISDNQTETWLIITINDTSIGTFPWLSLSVILAKTRLKGLILIILSTYQGW